MLLITHYPLILNVHRFKGIRLFDTHLRDVIPILDEVLAELGQDQLKWL